MVNPSSRPQLGIVRSAAVISLGLVALAGSVAASLYRRMTAPPGSPASKTEVSRLVLDEWEADLARMNLPSRRELDALNHQISALEAQIDQLIQSKSNPKEEE